MFMGLTDPYEHRGWKFLAVIAGPFASVVVAALAVWMAIQLVRRKHLALAAASMAIGVCAIASWWGAVPLARRWSGWSDPDGDGIFGDFRAGAYDSLDWYGGHWGAVVLCSAAICGASLLVLRLAAKEPAMRARRPSR